MGSMATRIVERNRTLQNDKIIADIWPKMVAGIMSPNPTDATEITVNQTALNMGSKLTSF